MKKGDSNTRRNKHKIRNHTPWHYCIIMIGYMPTTTTSLYITTAQRSCKHNFLLLFPCFWSTSAFGVGMGERTPSSVLQITPIQAWSLYLCCTIVLLASLKIYFQNLSFSSSHVSARWSKHGSSSNNNEYHEECK